MKLLIEKNVLMEGLNSVSKALSSRNIIPILNGIKFDLKEDGLYLTATDNEITIQSFINKDSIKSIFELGVTVIYGKSLLEIIRRLPNTDILIENFENNEVSFKTDNSNYNFNCFAVEDFPKITLEDAKTSIRISSMKLKEAISKTSFACSLQESRPLLTGVNIKVQGNLFQCTATDSYRLSKFSFDIDEICNENINIVIPARNINELMKIINDDEEIEMHIFGSKVIFKFNNLIFQTSLLNGTYPNTDNSIAKDFKYIIKVDLKELYNTIDRASLLAQSKDKNIIDVEILGENFIIRASSVEMGKVEEKLNIENITNNDLRISFSAKYMLDALKNINSEFINIMFNGEINPIIIKEIDNESFIQLILPMITY